MSKKQVEILVHRCGGQWIVSEWSPHKLTMIERALPYYVKTRAQVREWVRETIRNRNPELEFNVKFENRRDRERRGEAMTNQEKFIRRVHKKFSDLMLKELLRKKNMEKVQWRECSGDAILWDLSWKKNQIEENIKRRKNAIHLANYAMMVWDIFRKNK
jgi:hypothetical protein